MVINYCGFKFKLANASINMMAVSLELAAYRR